MQNSTIGYRLKERRVELRLTQAQVAEKAHLSTSQICYFESGKRSPSANIINTLSEVLDCSVDWLLKGVSPQNSEKAPSSDKPIMEDTKLLNIRKILEMYLCIDTADQDEIRFLLELKYRKKEKEWNELLSDLLAKHTDSSTL